jgi:hypothetical protein
MDLFEDWLYILASSTYICSAHLCIIYKIILLYIISRIIKTLLDAI